MHMEKNKTSFEKFKETPATNQTHNKKRKCYFWMLPLLWIFGGSP